ncbi:MAG TPA: PIN domain-containing protein [Steroidobacteraceae bacterium]|nr:PIN domain-containing protein [Steroidobacteraceae bacterium]
MASFTVIYDACLLYPPSVRDLVVELARTGLFRAKWTARINAEWINAAMRHRPELDRTRLERAAALMNSAIPDSLVSGFEQLESGLAELPDPDDRHVLAAAIHCGAQEIVTFNLRDFPETMLQPYGIRAIHPDASVEHVFDLNLEAASEAVRRIRRRLINPLVSAQEMIAGYERNGLAVSASILRARVNSL